MKIPSKTQTVCKLAKKAASSSSVIECKLNRTKTVNDNISCEIRTHFYEACGLTCSDHELNSIQFDFFSQPSAQYQAIYMCSTHPCGCDRQIIIIYINTNFGWTFFLRFRHDKIRLGYAHCWTSGYERNQFTFCRQPFSSKSFRIPTYVVEVVRSCRRCCCC